MTIMTLGGAAVLHDGAVLVQPPAGAPTARLHFTAVVDPAGEVIVTLSSVPEGVAAWAAVIRLLDGRWAVARRRGPFQAGLAPVSLGILDTILPELETAGTDWRAAVELIPVDAEGREGRPGRRAVLALPDQVVPEPVVITFAPEITIEGGAGVGGRATAVPPQFAGGPLIGDMLVQFLITDSGGGIPYGGQDDAHASLTFAEIADLALLRDIPAAWIGRRLAVRYTLEGELGTVVVWTDVTPAIEGVADPIPPEPLAGGQWAVAGAPAPAPDAATHYIVRFPIGVAAEVRELQWCRVSSSRYPDIGDEWWNPCEDLGGGLWLALRQDGSAPFTWLTASQSPSQPGFRLRHKAVPDGAWSAPTPDLRRYIYVADEPEPVPSGEGWRNVPYKVHAAVGHARELENSFGGEQYWNYMERSTVDHDFIFAVEDVCGSWSSDSAGERYKKSRDLGLASYNGISGACDPDNPSVVLGAFASTASMGEDSYNGIFRSEDRADSWTPVYRAPAAHGNYLAFNRTRCKAFCYDRVSPASYGTRRVWAVLPVRGSDPSASATSALTKSILLVSPDSGVNWSRVRDLAAGAAAFGRCNTLQQHPSIANRLFLGTDTGLWRSNDAGPNWTLLTDGSIISIEINPANGNEIYIVKSSTTSTTTGGKIGLYRTLDGGATWSGNLAPAGYAASQVAIGFQNGGGWAPLASRTIYLWGRGVAPRVSHNGGSTWFTPTSIAKAGSTGYPNDATAASGTGNPFRASSILPHPLRQDEAIFHANAKTWRTLDRGVTIFYSAAGFEGQQFHSGRGSIAFSRGAHANAHREWYIGCEDTGAFFTRDGGQTYHLLKPQIPRRALPHLSNQNSANITNSCFSVALHPTDSTRRITYVGSNTSEEGQQRNIAVVSTKDHPGPFSTGDLTIIPGTQGGNSRWSHWHKSKPSVCYWFNFKLTNAETSPVRTGYGSGLLGFACAAWEGNNDYLLAYHANGFQISLNQGGSWASFVTTGYWPVHRDQRRPIVAWHPTNVDRIFTITAGRDLARYDRNTDTWKTNYRLLARTRAEQGIPSDVDVRLKSIDIDINDPNVGYVSVEAYGWSVTYRALNFQSDNPTFEAVMPGLCRLNAPNVFVHPMTGDAFASLPGHGGAYILPPPDGGVRPRPSLAGAFPLV